MFPAVFALLPWRRQHQGGCRAHQASCFYPHTALSDCNNVVLQAARPGFFRQNSARSFKLLDLRRTNQSPHSTSSGGLSSPAQLSPPSTPASLEHAPWTPVCSYSRSGYRIPTVCFLKNEIHLMEPKTHSEFHLIRSY